MNKELWDLYDKDGNRTGEIWERRHDNYRNIPDGRYHLAYYLRTLKNGSHTAYLVFDSSEFIGAGGISYYTVMPTYHNPTGKKANIMNMYMTPTHRRKGIATKTLALLVQDAKERGITSIGLEATEMGKPLYEKYGFVPVTSEMELPMK